MDSQPLVSIVTPFYNTREFLEEAIESVLAQSYDHWEYILVDNQSTDGSSELAKSYACRFAPKVRLIRTESFLPQIQNYNFALSCISKDSKYTKVVQADDWIFPDCVGKMVEVAEPHPTVGIVGAYQLEGDVVSLDGLPYPTNRFPGHEICRRYFLNGLYLFGTPTSLLMRSELVRSRNPFYDERFEPFEDGHACFELLKTWDYGFAHQVLTYSRRDNESEIARMRPFRLDFQVGLSMLIAHGRQYLSGEEYDRCLRIAEWDYFSFLCRSALRGQSREFWEFHRKGLESLHYSLGWPLLRRYMPSALCTEAAGEYPPNQVGVFDPITTFARLKLAAKMIRSLRRFKWQIDTQIGTKADY